MSVDETDYAAEAQRAAEMHLEACWAYENGDGPEPEGLIDPFCGCLTCEVREVLRAAEPYLRAMWETE